jgi:pyridoxal phosphate enzyme (YggS family)
MIDPDPIAEAIAGRWLEIKRRIEGAAMAVDRDPGSIRLIAVTKGLGIEIIRAARGVGLDHFGESRVQEAEAKIAAVPDADWHLVGHLQSNKARRGATLFSWIHAIDSVDLLARVDALATGLQRQPRILIQVNVTSSPTQHGFGIHELAADTPIRASLGAELAGLRSVSVEGLMAIGPATDDPAISRAAFSRLRRLRDDLEQTLGHGLPELSMGMSDDFEPAVMEGATQVRVGTALFGVRGDSD